MKKGWFPALVILVVCLFMPMNLVFGTESYDTTPPWFSGVPSSGPYGTLNDPYTLPGLTYTFWCTVEDNQTPQTALLVDLNISICEGPPLPEYPMLVSLIPDEVQDQYVYHRLVNLVTIPDDVDRMFRFGFTVTDEEGLQTKAEQYANVINPSPPSNEHVSIESFHGFTVSMSYATGVYAGNTPFTNEQYAKIRSWGINSISYEGFWTRMIEPYETQAGVYDQTVITELKQQVKLCRQNGIYPIIIVRGPYNNDNLPNHQWMGWGIKTEYGWDYINNNLDPLNIGIGGRDRFINMWKMMAREFPDSGLSLTFFPYHQDSASDSEVTRLHTVTLPALYQGIRPLTDEFLIIYPNSQGQSAGISTGQYSYLEQYGWTPFPNVTYDNRLILGFNNHCCEGNEIVMGGTRWRPATVDRYYGPLLVFKEKYKSSGVRYGCGESTPLKIFGTSSRGNDCSTRPIKQERIDWAKYHYSIMEINGLDRWYYAMNQHFNFAGPSEPDWSDTQIITDILRPFGTQLASLRYSLLICPQVMD